MTQFRGINTDPLRNFKFKVEFAGVNGEARAGFSRVSGLKETVEPVDYREGTDPGRMRKLPGQTSWDNVVCERGLTVDPELITWCRLLSNKGKNARGRNLTAEGEARGNGIGSATQGDLVRREVAIILGDYHAEAGDGGAWTWTLLDAWPTSYEVGEMAGDGNDVVMETVEFVHEGMDVAAPGA